MMSVLYSHPPRRPHHRSTGTRQRFRDRASQGLSLCFALCESLIDALADTQNPLGGTQGPPEDPLGGTPLGGTQAPPEDPRSVQGGDPGERALLQVLGNMDDVAGLVLQFVEQPGGDANVVLAGVRVLGRYECLLLLCALHVAHEQAYERYAQHIPTQVLGRVSRCP